MTPRSYVPLIFKYIHHSLGGFSMGRKNQTAYVIFYFIWNKDGLLMPPYVYSNVLMNIEMGDISRQRLSSILAEVVFRDLKQYFNHHYKKASKTF